MQEKVLSIIVPCFNKEKSIDKTLNSIIEQTIFNNMVIICVDDCSTDGTYNKLLTWRRRSPSNFVIIKLDTNSSVFEARRVGLGKATTPYVAFLDSDDYVCKQFYEILYRNITHYNADIVCTKQIYICEGDKIELIKDFNNIDIGIYTNTHDDENKVFRAILHVMAWPVIWDKIYRRSLFNYYTNGVSMYTNNYEDNYMYILTIATANKVIVINDDKCKLFYNNNPDVQHMHYSNAIVVNGKRKNSNYCVLSNMLIDTFLVENNLFSKIDIVRKWRKNLLKEINEDVRINMFPH